MKETEMGGGGGCGDEKQILLSVLVWTFQAGDGINTNIFLQVFREFCHQIGVENIRYAYRFRSSFYTENVTNLTLLCSLLEVISLS